MQRITQVGVLSAAKVYGIIAGTFGLLLGVFVSLFSLLGAGMAMMGGGDRGGGLMGLLFGAGAIVIMPLFYGVIGFVAGALQAFVFNYAARFTGGIEVRIEPMDPLA